MIASYKQARPIQLNRVGLFVVEFMVLHGNLWGHRQINIEKGHQIFQNTRWLNQSKGEQRVTIQITRRIWMVTLCFSFEIGAFSAREHHSIFARLPYCARVMRTTVSTWHERIARTSYRFFQSLNVVGNISTVFCLKSQLLETYPRSILRTIFYQ